MRASWPLPWRALCSIVRCHNAPAQRPIPRCRTPPTLPPSSTITAPPPTAARSIVGENIPILTGEEKYNETVTSSVKRVVAKLTGKEDPGAPFR